MDSQEITLRWAQPSPADGAAFAHYMDIASEGGFRKLFGKRFEEIVGAAYMIPNHDLSYETALFAECEGKPVGMASGYTATAFAGFDQDALLRSAGPSRFRVSCALMLMAPMLRALHTYQAGDFYLEFLAVDADRRGQGIGAKLIGAMEAHANEVGSSQLAIDVSARNPNARRLYERQGFVLQSEWPRAKWIPTGVQRLSKTL